MAEMKRREKFWNPWRDADLLAMRAKGYTFWQIAEVLGCTKNAALGHARRLVPGVIEADNADRAERLRIARAGGVLTRARNREARKRQAEERAEYARRARLSAQAAEAAEEAARWHSRVIADLGAEARRDMRAVSLLHLLDLKRAGHSPARTELNIVAHSSVPRMYASCAALCAEG